MELNIREIVDKKEKEQISEEILNNLPEWFGMPESTQEYIDDSKDKPFLACFIGDEEVGFVMGIKKKYHRQGIGRKLNETYEKMAKKLGYTYSQVKTVEMGHYDEYDITNKFYMSMGYKKLECFPTLWDEWNPCQVYVKYLGE